jgi:hypothetical protein
MNHPEIISRPLGTESDGQLDLHGGMYRTVLRADSRREAPLLFSAEFSGDAPQVNVQGGRVAITHGHLGWWPWSKARRSSAVALTSSIPWRVRVDGGVCSLNADLREVDTREFEIRGGACDVDLELGRPRGLVPLRIHGGACGLRIVRPAGVAVRVHVEGGALDLSLDAFHASSVGGSTHWETPGFGEEGFDVRILGGVSRLVVGVAATIRAQRPQLEASA